MTMDSVNMGPGAPGGWNARVRRVSSAGRAAVDSLRLRRALADLERFCFFVGYARSGSTLIGALLNAHPEVVVANELDVLRQVDLGLSRNRIFSLLLDRERQFAAMGYQWTGYDYTVPGQYQGRFERLRVIGDKRAGRSTHRLGENPELLDLVRSTVGMPIRVIHVVRNPFDNVATMARRGQRGLSPAIANYLQLSRTVDCIRTRLEPDELLDVRYESFTEHPEQHLLELCTFLGVHASADYLKSCASLVHPSTTRSRDTLLWSPAERFEIEAVIERCPVLAGYEFDA